jgi:hypothetical protein
MLSAALLAIVAASVAVAQEPTGTYPSVPLASKKFNSPADLPYQVDTDNLVRGRQHGYNICNSTTENQKSLCQTFYFNGPGDFCITGPSEYGKEVGSIEGEMIAWCSKPGHGSRLIPDGAITGLEFRKTPDYVQVVGFIDQTQINILKGDFGGEMDPHGADLRGNPMGGVFFSDAFGGGLKQVIEWTNFMGSNSFALKACDQSKPNAAKNCEHVYDRIGSAYNMPNAAVDGKYVVCDAPSADFPGVYTDAAGQVQTYTQPPESLGAIQTMPYQPKVPQASNCKTLQSAELFTGLPKATATNGGSSSSTSASGAAKPTGGAAGASTTKSGAAGPAQTGGADIITVSAFASIMGVAFSALFLA